MGFVRSRAAAGSKAATGRRPAVADFGPYQRAVLSLIGFRDRVTIVMEWLWAYVIFQRGARPVTGP